MSTFIITFVQHLLSDGSYSLIIDKSVPIGQLAVASRHQMLMFLTSECCSYCFSNKYCIFNGNWWPILFGLSTAMYRGILPMVGGCAIITMYLGGRVTVTLVLDIPVSLSEGHLVCVCVCVCVFFFTVLKLISVCVLNTE